MRNTTAYRFAFFFPTLIGLILLSIEQDLIARQLDDYAMLIVEIDSALVPDLSYECADGTLRSRPRYTSRVLHEQHVNDVEFAADMYGSSERSVTVQYSAYSHEQSSSAKKIAGTYGLDLLEKELQQNNRCWEVPQNGIVIPVKDGLNRTIIIKTAEDIVELQLTGLRHRLTKLRIPKLDQGVYRVDASQQVFLRYQDSAIRAQENRSYPTSFTITPLDWQACAISSVQHNTGNNATVLNRLNVTERCVDISLLLDNDTLLVLGRSELVALSGDSIVARLGIPQWEGAHRHDGAEPRILYDTEGDGTDKNNPNKHIYVGGDSYDLVAIEREGHWNMKSVRVPSRAYLHEQDEYQWLLRDDPANMMWTSVAKRKIQQEYAEMDIVVGWLLPDTDIQSKFQLGRQKLGNRSDANVTLLHQAELQWTPGYRYAVPWDTLGYAVRSENGLLAQFHPHNHRTKQLVVMPEWFRQLHAMDFTSTGTGVVVGDLGTIFRTTDYGGSWSYHVIDTELNLSAVEILGPDLLVVGTTGGELLWLRMNDMP